MTCKQISIKLSAYLDQELTTGDVKQVQEHLVTCELCRLELVELRKNPLCGCCYVTRNGGIC